MKKKVSFILSLSLLLIIIGGSQIAASPAKGESASNAQEPILGYKAGLWQEGKAAFSDIELFDLFWEHPRGYAPVQPIPFSHKVHIEKGNVECQYCHSGVNKSSYATIPSLESCMGCHKSVLPKSENVKKMAEAFDNNEPIEWEPVHHLPEHVAFTHERHVKAGVSCQMCHGQVQRMDVVEKVSSLKMGFCVSCHREYGASLDCLTCHY